MESTRTMTLNTAEKTKVSTLAEATSNISQTVSSESVKIHEAMEFCSKAELKSNELKAEAKKLAIEKNESLQVRDELILRNKANAANWENWVQTKYELDRLKCDLKAEVMMSDIAAQAKRAKYIKTITLFRRQWEETENQYKNFPEVKEFVELQKLNESLSNEIQKRENLLHSTVCEYSELLKVHKENLQRKFIELASEKLSLVKLRHFDQEKQEKEERVKNLREELQQLQNLQNSKKEDTTLHFKPSISHFDIKNAFNQAALNTKNYSAVDITAFDKISIPIENLETSTDEDLFSFSKYKTSEVDSSTQSDALSDNNSEGGDSQVLSPTENNQIGSQNQYSSHFQAQGQTQIEQQVAEEAPTANQTSHYWAQKENEVEKEMVNQKNLSGKFVRFAIKKTGQEVMEEPQSNMQDVRDKEFQQTDEQGENNEPNFEAPEVDDQSFQFDDTYDNYSNKSYGSFEADAPDRSLSSPDNSFLNDTRAQEPIVTPIAPSPPPKTPTLDTNPLQNLFPIDRAESPAPAQPFNFMFNTSAPAKTSIFNLF